MNITEAQTITVNQVGILSPMDANGEKDVWDAFKDGLTELGYSEGKGVTFVSRFAEGNYDRLPAFAADLVQLGVDVIVPATPPAIKAAKSATSTIPIVFPVGSDPVELGLHYTPIRSRTMMWLRWLRRGVWFFRAAEYLLSEDAIASLVWFGAFLYALSWWNGR